MTEQFDVNISTASADASGPWSVSDAAASPSVSVKQRSLLDATAFWVITLTALLIPALFFPSQSVPFLSGKAFIFQLGAVIAFCLWAIAGLRSGRLKYPSHPLWYSSAVFVALTLLLSTIFSGSFKLSFFGQGYETSTFVSIVLLFVISGLASILLDSKKRMLKALLVFSISLALIALYHVLRLIFGIDFLTLGLFEGATSNFVGKWNDLAIIFGMGAVLSAVALEMLDLSALFRTLIWIVLAVFLILLCVINFFTVWVALVVFGVCFSVYTVIIGRKRESAENSGIKSLIPVAGAVIVAVGLIMSADSLVGNAIFGFEFRTKTIGQSISERLDIFQLETRPSWTATTGIALKTLKESPVLGAVPNRFINQWQIFKPIDINRSIFWSVNYDFGVGFLPTFLITGGLLSGAAWILFLLIFLALGVRVSMAPVADKLGRFISITSFLSAAFGWAMSILYVPSLPVLVVTFFFTGMFLAAVAEERLVARKTFVFADRARAGFVSAVLLIVFIVAGMAVGLSSFKKFASATALQRGLQAFNIDGDLDKTETYLKSSVASSPTDVANRFLSELSLVRINRLLNDQSGKLSGDQVSSKFQELFGLAVLYADGAVGINPLNYQNLVAFGRVYESVVSLGIGGSKEAYDKANKIYEDAEVLNPMNPEIDLIQARLAVVNKDMKLAREKIKEALEKKNNYTEAIFMLSQVEASEGNIVEAIRSAEAAAIIEPNDPVVYFQLGLLKYTKKDYQGAIGALERAISLNSEYANARYYLGLSYDGLGRKSDALAQFETIQKTNQDNELVKAVIANLKDGRSALRGVQVGGANPSEGLPIEETRVTATPEVE